MTIQAGRCCILIICLCMAVLLGGCSQPTIEELAAKGIQAEEYSHERLAGKVEQAAVTGNTAFVVNYIGDLGDVGKLESGEWRQNYVCRRFVDTLSVTYEELEGFVRASYHMTLKDGSLLAAVARNGMAVREISDEAIEDCIEEMLLAGEAYQTFIFQPLQSIEDFDARVYQGVEYARKHSFACEYMTEKVSWVATDYTDMVELEFRLEYSPRAVPLKDMPVVSQRQELLDMLVELWNKRVTATAAVMLDGFSMEEDELMALLDVAVSNCALAPCEADKLWFEKYPEQGGKQIIVLWLETPLSWDELAPKAEELKEEVQRRGSMISSRHSEAEKLYRAIYREVISAAKYDDEMSDATVSRTLTDRMRIGRSAYGALVDGYTVCSGYASAYKALCDYLGLECYVISGTHEGDNHAWNMVVLNGEELYVDCSFADTGGGSAYCLFDREKMEREGYVPAESFQMMWELIG